MINMYVVRRLAALFIPALFSTVGYIIGTLTLGELIGTGIMILCLIIGIFIGTAILANPFSKMLEGGGIMALKIDSTGIIEPFICQVKQPFVSGRVQGREVTDTFNRQAVFQFKLPQFGRARAYMAPAGTQIAQKAANSDHITENIPACNHVMIKQNGLVLTLDEEQYNKARFQFLSYPCLVYNAQLGSFVTKDSLSSMEKDIFAEHTIIYLIRVLEQLTQLIRDFARYVVELLKPGTSLLSNKWFWIILIGGLVVLAAIFLPQIISAGQNAAASTPLPGMPTNPMTNPVPLG